MYVPTNRVSKYIRKNGKNCKEKTEEPTIIYGDVNICIRRKRERNRNGEIQKAENW